MGIELYAFVLFVFLLVCLAMFLAKRLFADMNSQKKMLDEKEQKLLLLYRTVEESLEEFFDQVDEAKSDIKLLGAVRTQNEPIGPETQANSWKPAEAAAAPAEAPRFQRVMDELVDDKTESQAEKNAVAPSRNEVIMLLWNEGKDKTQIAQVLGITKTEVEIVLGLNGNTPKTAKISPDTPKA